MTFLKSCEICALNILQGTLNSTLTTTTIDADQCSLGTHTCHAQGTCSNTDDGFDCECNSGFLGNGFNCTDVNECMNGQNDCDSNATCANIPGNFSCACNNGYVGDGKICEDINECINGNHDCDLNATCKNTSGSFTCTCRNGYSGDGSACDLDECLNGDTKCDVNFNPTVLVLSTWDTRNKPMLVNFQGRSRIDSEANHSMIKHFRTRIFSQI